MVDVFGEPIAAMRLNPRDAKRACPGEPPSLVELLREGKLHFKHEGGKVHEIDSSADDDFALNV